MTYATEIQAKPTSRVGFYVAFAGIAERFATHDMSLVGLPGTYLPVIKAGSWGGAETKLDRELSFVEPGGVSFRAMNTGTVNGIVRRRGGVRAQLTMSVGPGETSISTNDTTPVSPVVSLQGETILRGTWNATFSRYDSCTRGHLGSLATAHRSGSIMATAPTHWLNRLMTLHEVNLETGSEAQAGAYLLARSP